MSLTTSLKGYHLGHKGPRISLAKEIDYNWDAHAQLKYIKSLLQCWYLGPLIRLKCLDMINVIKTDILKSGRAEGTPEKRRLSALPFTNNDQHSTMTSTALIINYCQKFHARSLLFTFYYLLAAQPAMNWT